MADQFDGELHQEEISQLTEAAVTTESFVSTTPAVVSAESDCDRVEDDWDQVVHNHKLRCTLSY